MAYPNRTWNAWKKAGDPAASAFVRPNSLRLGPDGLLWIVDTGTSKSDASPVPNGPKMLALGTMTNQLCC